MYIWLQPNSTLKMKKLLQILFLIVIIQSSIKAQTFSNNTSVTIPDNNSMLEIPVTVSGLPNAINNTFGLSSVCLSLNHSFIGQLVAVLISPNGSDSIRLMWHDGGNNAINGNLCFTEAGSYYIAFFPVTGVTNYYGEDDNNIMNNGRNPNGQWLLHITDIVPGSSGSINGISITFSNNPPPTHNRSFGCSNGTPWGCQCPDGSDTCDLLPDMTNAKASLQNHLSENSTEIRFAVATPNIGYGPLEMNGSTTQCFCDTTPVPCGTACPTGQELKHTVRQKIYTRSGNAMSYSQREAGLMELHPTHNHIHVDHWTNNTLRIKTRDNDPRNWPILGSAYKISFCLINLGTCDSYVNYCVDNNGNVLHTTDIPNYGFGMVSGCSLNQGIYPGKVDEYSAGISGQSIPLAGLCNGNYYLVSITDPDDVVKEIDEDNNYSYVPVRLTQRPCNTCSANFYADTLHGVDSLTVNFTDSTIAIPDSWLWDFGDGTSSTEQFPTHTYTQPGNYTVRLTTSANLTSGSLCRDTATKTAYIKVVASPRADEIYVNAGPNPFSSYINLFTNSYRDLPVTVEVFDILGRKISNQSIRFKEATSPYRLESSNFGIASGMYLVRIGYNGKFNTIKVLKSQH